MAAGTPLLLAQADAPAEDATVDPVAEPAGEPVEAEGEGLVETIIDAVTGAVEEVIPGDQAEDAGEAEATGDAEPEDEATEGAAEGAAEGATEDEGLVETIIDAVTDAVEGVIPGGEGEEAAEAEAAHETTETVGVADDHGDPHAEEVPGVEGWLILALVILILIAYRPARRAIFGALDQRAGRIRDELEEAKRLHEEAHAALANFQRRQRDALGEAEEIIAHARDEAARLREHATAELEQTLKRREAMAMDRIAQAEVAATAEIRDIAVDVAIAAAREVIGENLDKPKSDTLVEAAIQDLPNKLH